MPKPKGKPKPKPPVEKPAPKPAGKPDAKPSGKGGGKAASGFNGYLERTKLPVYSLTFVLPLVLIYEWAIVLVNQRMMREGVGPARNAFDDLIRGSMSSLLSSVGLHGFFLSGILVAAVLLAWQIVSRKPWEVKLGTLLGMLGESIAWAILPPVLAYYIIDPILNGSFKLTIEVDLPAKVWLMRDLVLACGAGVYEEFIFRLVLVWLLAMVVAGFTGISWQRSTLIAVILQAFAFAGCHHMGLMGQVFTWKTFIFRTCMGIFFGAIYYYRGFGVAVGTHALYDVFYSILIRMHTAQGGPI